MPKIAKYDTLLSIDTKSATQYILDNFNLSGEAQRMCANLFDYIAHHDGRLARHLMLDILDGIGFNEGDLITMTGRGILSWRD